MLLVLVSSRYFKTLKKVELQREKKFPTIRKDGREIKGPYF